VLYRVVIAIMLVLGLFAGQATPVAACSCIVQTHEEYFERAEYVFQGRVIRVESRRGDERFTTRALLAVETVWKGPAVSEVAVVGAEHSAGCAVVFREGQQLVVFARDYAADGLATDICNGTGAVSSAEAVASFGDGTSVRDEAPAHATTQPANDEDGALLSAPLRVVALLIGLIVVVVVFLALRWGRFV
jgi:hypothetical protein